MKNMKIRREGGCGAKREIKMRGNKTDFVNADESGQRSSNAYVSKSRYLIRRCEKLKCKGNRAIITAVKSECQLELFVNLPHCFK